MRRWIKRLLIASLAIVLVLAGALAWELRTGDLFDHLVRDARIAYAPRHRLLHIDSPLHASFAEIVGPAIPTLGRAFNTARGFSRPVLDACRDVREGKRPWKDAPAPCRDMLTAAHPALEKTLLATHADVLEFPPETSPLRAEFWAKHAPLLPPYESAGWLAALDIRRRLETNDAVASPTETEAVADECVDALALGRDVSYAGGVMALIFGAAITRTLLQPCLSALAALSPMQRKSITRSILRVRDGWDTLEGIWSDELLYGRIALAARTLPRDQLDRLPKPAADLARQDPSGRDPILGRLAPVIDRMMWRDADLKGAEMLRAAALPASERRTAITRLESEWDKAESPFTFWDIHTKSLNKGRDRVQALLTLLAGVGEADSFHALHNRWPTLRELAASVPGFDSTAFISTPHGNQFTLALPGPPDDRVMLTVGASKTR